MSAPEPTPALDLSLRDLEQFAEGLARRLAASFAANLGLDPTDRGR
jgi:hypothetical protein